MIGYMNEPVKDKPCDKLDHLMLAVCWLAIGIVGGAFLVDTVKSCPECPKCEDPAVTASTVDWERWPVDSSQPSSVNGVLYIPAANMKIASPAEYCRQRDMVLRSEFDDGAVLCLEQDMSRLTASSRK